MADTLTVDQRAYLRATIFDNPYVPDRCKRKLNARQAVFLCDLRRDVLYGGAGGGGKSAGLLLAAAQYVTRPGYSALILRRTYAQLDQADSILDQAKGWWLSDVRIHYHAASHTFTFPSGARIKFGHLQYERAKYNIQGSAYQFVGLDELTQFPESLATYPFTRLRRLEGSNVPVRFRAGTNPGGVGHHWVKARYYDSATRKPGTGFVPAKLKDNAENIDAEDYVKSLAGTDALTRAQILDGDWNAVAGGRFKPEWLMHRYTRDGEFYVTPRGDRFLLKSRPVFMTCDPSASASKLADNFALSTWCVTPCARLMWVNCRLAKLETPDQVKICQSEYARWHPQFLGVEEVMNQRALAQTLRQSQTPVMVIRSLSPRSTDKLARAVGGINLAADGRLLLPDATHREFPIDDVVGELTTFTGEKGGKDDAVDTLSYAAELLPLLGTTPSAPGYVPPKAAPLDPPPRPTPARPLSPPQTPQRGPRPF